MKKIGVYIGTVLLMIVGCNGVVDSEQIVDDGAFDSAFFMQEIHSVDSLMMTGMPEKKDIKKAIVLYQDFAKYFPNNPKAPNYLFQTSDFYLNMGNVKKAVDVLTSIIETYPKYDRIETIYFTRASHVDLDLRDTTLAKTYYQEFLNLYPDSEYANDAKTRMDNVGLSMEDLIKNFEKMNAN